MYLPYSCSRSHFLRVYTFPSVHLSQTLNAQSQPQNIFKMTHKDPLIMKQRSGSTIPYTTMHQTPLFVRFLSAAILMAAVLGSATAFQVIGPIISSSSRRPSTTLFLEDHIANMIDDEMRRLYQKHETESQWNAKQRAWKSESNVLPENYDFEAEFEFVEPATVQGFTSGVDRSISSPRRRKDEKMMESDPMRYCADRCVSTGNCDVLEDMFDFSPEEVIKFCTECVLSEDETPCDVPASLFEDDVGTGGEFESEGLHP